MDTYITSKICTYISNLSGLFQEPDSGISIIPEGEILLSLVNAVKLVPIGDNPWLLNVKKIKIDQGHMGSRRVLIPLLFL